MKKILLSILLMLLPILANADPVEVDGIWYNLIPKGNVAEVTKNPSGDKYAGDVTIPDKFTYDGVEYRVTKILDQVFKSCALKSIIIGNNVTSISEYAFWNCSSLESVSIGKGVTSIGQRAFMDCNNLTSVHISDIEAWSKIAFSDNPLIYAHHLYLNGEEIKDLVIPNSVTSISRGAFAKCSGLTSVTFPNSVTSIGSSAFMECSGLTSVTIPNSIIEIGEEAFYDCNSLSSVHISDFEAWCGIKFHSSSNPLAYAHHLYLNGEEIKDLVIPNDMTSIGEYTFSGCSGLTSVTIPNSVTSIGSSAFSGCSSLTSVTIPNSVTSIGNYAFSGCSSLTSVTIPNSVTFIGRYTFYNCSNLKTVTIPISVATIGARAFERCSSLTSVSIGKGVKSIGEGAFSDCSNLTSVHISDIKAWCGINFPYHDSNPLYYAHHLYLDGEEIKDLVIPNSVETIRDYTFADCRGLTSVIISNSVISIGDGAFWNCELITDVYCLPENVRNNKNDGEGLYTHPSAFENSYQEYITLHVPAASAEAYGALEPWKSFKEIVALNGEDIPEIPVTPKCAMPTISLVDGKITFSCETEGVEYISEVTVNDAKKYYDNEISAPKKFKVTVYATKASYDNSDTATAEFDFSGDTSLSGDVDGNGIVNVADHVKLSDIIMNK